MDIIPSKAGKGKALHFLIDELRRARQQAVATAECCLPELGIQVRAPPDGAEGAHRGQPMLTIARLLATLLRRWGGAS